MTRAFVATTTVLTLLAAPAFAIVTEIDTDGDGAYSLAEVQTAMPDMSFDAFNALDTNADGLLDAEEVAAAIEAGLMPDPAG